MLERQITDKIMAYLKALPGCYAFKEHGSGYTSGQPDIIGCYRGKCFLIEVKRPGGRPTQLQLKILAAWSKSGAYTAVVYSLDEAKEFMKGLMEDVQN